MQMRFTEMEIYEGLKKVGSPKRLRDEAAVMADELGFMAADAAPKQPELQKKVFSCLLGAMGAILLGMAYREKLIQKQLLGESITIKGFMQDFAPLVGLECELQERFAMYELFHGYSDSLL